MHKMIHCWKCWLSWVSGYNFIQINAYTEDTSQSMMMKWEWRTKFTTSCHLLYLNWNKDVKLFHFPLTINYISFKYCLLSAKYTHLLISIFLDIPLSFSLPVLYSFQLYFWFFFLTNSSHHSAQRKIATTITSNWIRFKSMQSGASVDARHTKIYVLKKYWRNMVIKLYNIFAGYSWNCLINSCKKLFNE